MRLIQYRPSKSTPNKFYIEGTNQFLDLFITGDCWSSGGTHNGIRKATLKLYNELGSQIDKDSIVILDGYSMGGSIVIELGRLLTKLGYTVKAEVRGAYPIYKDNIEVVYGITITEYGNDPIPLLFPKFSFPVDSKMEHIGPERIKGKICFKDHIGYKK